MRTEETLRPPIDVLIVEDDLSIRETLRYLLEREGYTCAVADNGREAVELAQASPPRLVLLDLMMPELDGFRAARQLRRDPRTRDVHIHCLTGRTDRAARMRARRAGCEVYLTKPMDVEGILDVICVTLNCEVHSRKRPWRKRNAVGWPGAGGDRRRPASDTEKQPRTSRCPSS